MTRWNRRSDAELLAATADAPEAFATFYRRHEQAILAYFLRRTANVEVAADLAAEVFAAALESSSRFRPGPTPARGWLFGIARHVLAMSARRGRVDAEVRRRLQMAPIVLSDEIVDRLESLRRQALAIAEVALLPDDQREAVAAHVMNDDSYAEIADRLGCSEQVVRKRVSRGLAGLRQRLEEELG